MTEERKIQIVAEVDATRARAGFNEISQQGGIMAGNLVRSGAQAERAISEIGNGANASAAKVEAAQRNLIGSIQRTTAAMEAGSRTGAAYYETLARQRGVDPSVLAPYLAQLKAIEDAQARAAQTQSALQAVQAQAAEATRAQASAQAAAQREQAQTQATRDSLLAGLREQIQLYGKSSDEVLRYRAAQAGVSQEAAQLILQLQNVRAAHEQIAEAARVQAQAQRDATQAQGARDSFLAGLREQIQLFGKSTDEVLRYRAAQAGAADAANPLIAQLQALRTAQEQSTRAQREAAQVQTGKDTFLAGLREQVQLYGKSSDEVLRYRAAQAGASAEAAQLILQLQNVRAAHERIAEAARTEAAALREAQQAQGRKDAFVSGLQQQAEAIGKTRSQLLELQAAQMGVTAQAAPFILRLREAEQGMNRTGMSAAATAAALRGVPAQFTDIVTSIQGGQAPLTVLLQQGGQLKDMFGGAKEAAKALGGYLLGLLNPYTVAAAAAGGLGFVYVQGASEARAYTQALILSGNAAGTTAGQLADLARKISASIGTQGAAAEALATLAGTGKVSAANLERFGELAIRAQRALGQSVADTAAEFADLGKSPVSSLEKLNDKYHFLTGSVYEHVRSLQEQGRYYDAGVAAQDAYATAFDGVTTKVTANLGTMQRFWMGVKDIAKETWDAMLNVGREDTLAEQLAKVRTEIAKAQKPYDASVGGNSEARMRLSDNLALQADLEKRIASEAHIATLKGDQARFNAADTEWSKTKFQYLTRQKQLETELEAQRNLGLASGQSDAAIEERLAVVRKKYADVYNLAIDSNIEALERRDAVEDALMQREIARIAAARAAGSMNEDDAINATAKEALASFDRQKALVEKKLALTKGKANSQKEQLALEGQIVLIRTQRQTREIQQQDDLAAAERKRWQGSNDLYGKGLVAASAERDGLIDQVKAQKESNEQIGLTAIQVARLQSARLEGLATLKDESAAALDAIAPGSALAQSYREQADALRDLASEKRSGAVKQATVDTVKAATEEWKRAAESIGDSLSDNIMRGGKSAAEYIRDLFRTMILKPVIQAAVNPVAGAAGSMLGMTGAASAAESAGGSATGSIMGSAMGSAFGAGGMAGSLAAGAGWLTGATTLGGSLAAGASLVGTGTLAGGMAGASMIVGALGPIALGIAAAVAIWKKLDTSGTYHTGGASSASSAGVVTIRAESLNFEATKVSAETEKMTAGLASGIVSILDSTALAFGKTAGYTAATAFADDTSKDGAWGALVISKLGAKMVDWQDSRGNGAWAPKVFADGAEGQKQYLAALSGSVRTALDGIGLPSWAQKMLDGLGDAPAIEDLAKVADAINSTQVALKAMGDQLVGFSGLSESAVSALMAASGGIQKLAAGASAYYDNFYSDAEKNASAIKQVGDALTAVGLTVPAARDDFRALVEAQMKLGEAGAPAVAKLFGVAGAFAQLHPLVDATTTALESQAGAMQKMKDTAASMLGDVDTAFSTLQKVTKSSTDALTARIDKEKALSDAIKSTLSGMKAPGNEAADRASAQAQIQTALAIAKAGGPLPDSAALQKALSALSQDASGLFATQQDYLRDFYRTQNDLAALGDLADDALSVDQRSLNALTDMLDASQRQIDILKGIDITGLSIAQALAGFKLAVATAQANPVNAATSGIAGMYTSLLGRAPDAAGLEYWQQQAAGGLSMDKIREYIMGGAEYKRTQGIPGFASGGMFGGGLRIVGENGPELEATGASRIWSGQQTAAILARAPSRSENPAVLAAAVERLTREVEGLRAEVVALHRDNSAENYAIAKHSMNGAYLLERLSEGGDAVRVRIEP